MVDADVLSRVLARWLPARATPVTVVGRRWRVVIAVDGKVERGARLGDGRQVHLLSAYDTSTGIVLAQVQIAVKSNEIAAFTPLMRLVAAQWGSLKDVLVVADALRAQTGHAELLAADGGHLMVAVKGNQPTLHAQLKPCPGRRSRSAARPARPATATRKPAQSKPSPWPLAAGWRFPTRSKPSGSPGPARSRARPAANRRT
ncbi:ISAs1 family transposase [Amycolatopsis sp. NPDC051061]|uniref:ISAs1 family transposase n=1 Tax=Amycolatopsis sp. NPDC051061 TaxID=3155042 RepID=UPI00342E8001